jgi:hypothetical protein
LRPPFDIIVSEQPAVEIAGHLMAVGLRATDFDAALLVGRHRHVGLFRQRAQVIEKQATRTRTARTGETQSPFRRAQTRLPLEKDYTLHENAQEVSNATDYCISSFRQPMARPYTMLCINTGSQRKNSIPAADLKELITWLKANPKRVCKGPRA